MTYFAPPTKPSDRVPDPSFDSALTEAELDELDEVQPHIGLGMYDPAAVDSQREDQLVLALETAERQLRRERLLLLVAVVLLLVAVAYQALR